MRSVLPLQIIMCSLESVKRKCYQSISTHRLSMEQSDSHVFPAVLPLTQNIDWKRLYHKAICVESIIIYKMLPTDWLSVHNLQMFVPFYSSASTRAHKKLEEGKSV